MEIILDKVNKDIRKFKTRDPFEIAHYSNITVKYAKFKKLKGFYKSMYRNRFIAINSSLSEREKTITCSHELGHDKLHRKISKLVFLKDHDLYNSTSIYEKEANLFSAELLIPDDDFIDCANTYNSYTQIAYELKIHEELVIIKALILNKKGYDFKIPYNPKSNYLKYL